MIDLQIWDIGEAYVPFEDDPKQSRRRPVLVITPTEFIVLKMTTHNSSEKPKPYEYEMMRWQDSGLTKKTFVQCNRFIRLGEKRFTGKKYGRLTSTDIIGVKAMMKYHGLIK